MARRTLNEIVKELHTVRLQELEAYRNILAHSEAQKHAISAMRDEDLSEITRQKGMQLEAIDALVARAGVLTEEMGLAGRGQCHSCLVHTGLQSIHCPINIEIAGLLQTLMEMEKSNQALMINAMGRLGAEIGVASSSRKAVRSYAARTPSFGIIDQNA